MDIENLTIESLRVSQPELYGELRERFIAEGRSLERERFLAGEK
jgi:hypothetical protein